MSDFPTIAPQPSEAGDPGMRVRLEGFQLSDELGAVADGLIDRHSRLRYLSDHRVAYILEHGDPPASMTTDSVAKAKRVTGWQRALTPYVAALVVSERVWQVLSERQREALVMHHLLHFDTNPNTGELVLVGHDVEEFHYVAATYGQWQPSLRNFAEQLELGMGNGQ